MLEDYALIAFKNLKKRSIRSWLTLLGIFIGIAAVVSLVSLGDGLQQAITGQFANAGADKLTIQAEGAGFAPPGSTAVERLTEKDLRAVERVKGIKVVADRLLRTTSLEFGEEKIFSFIVSLPEEVDERRLVLETFNLEPIEGRNLRPNDGNKIVLGYNFYTGDEFEKDIRIGNKVEVNGKEFRVVGFLDKQSSPQLNSIIMMNDDVVRDTLDIGDDVDLIVVQVNRIEDLEEVTRNLEEALRDSRDVDKGKEDFKIETPQQSAETFNAVLGVVQAVVVGIAAISLIVGGIGIANTMFTSVLERRREIGIMKSIGARNGSILMLFLIEAGSLGLVGGIIGVILGVMFSQFVVGVGSQFLTEGLLVAKYSYGLILGSMFFGFFVGIVSGIIPARQASKLPPVEALRS